MNLPRSARNGLDDAFKRSVRNFSKNIAITYKDRAWTFAEIDGAVQRVADFFLNSGLSAGDRLASYGKNSDSYVITFLACIRVGIIHVPVNYALVEEELAYILNQSGTKAVFFDPDLSAHVMAVKGQCNADIFGTLRDGSDKDILAVALGSNYPLLAERDVEPTDCVQLMYTSGTTSHPKGAIMTHQCLWSQYLSCIIHFHFRSEDIQLAALPLYHTAQMHAFVFPFLLVGATTILIDAPIPDVYFPIFEQHKVTAFFAPPTVWIGMLRHADFDRYDLSSLQKAYYGASIMPESIVKELEQRLPSAGLYNCYGQTELSPLATVLLPEQHQARPTSAGKPVLNVETRIVNQQMEDVAVGERGEIVHRSPHIMQGYWEKPEETAEAFTGDWFHSGDLGVMDDEGYIYIVDRIKDVINTGGVLVASRDVEEVLYRHPSVAEVAVIALDDEKWIEAITAVVILKEGCTLTSAELIDFAREHLAAFKIPKQVFFQELLPKNASGKILKRELREQLSTANNL